MKHKRDYHKEVRVVYRACRRLYGTEKTQDECLKIFKVVFPELNRLRQSKEPTAIIPTEVRDGLYQIVRQWHPKGALEKVYKKAEQYFGIPTECPREELIQFYEDIMPVVMRIRKLTPRECFRLMGVGEEDIDTIQSTSISNSKQYQLAGNSIVVDVLYFLFKNLLIDTDPKSKQPIQLTLF